jgi:predicted lipoprotein with Yx(FWY)xxD motif
MKKILWIVLAIIIVAAIVTGVVLVTKNSNNKNQNTSAIITSAPTKSSNPAVNNSILITKTDPSVGQYLADPSGKTLYTYNGDEAGISNCTGSCIQSWRLTRQVAILAICLPM